MVDITLEEVATNNPVSTDLDGSEPIETEISLVGRGLRLRQMSTTPLNAQTSSYTLVINDQGNVVTMDNGSANTLTVPPNASVAFPIGATLLVRQLGVGATSIVAGAGVTIEKKASVGLVLAEQFATVFLHKIATNTWHLAGELAAV